METGGMEMSSVRRSAPDVEEPIVRVWREADEAAAGARLIEPAEPRGGRGREVMFGIEAGFPAQTENPPAAAVGVGVRKEPLGADEGVGAVRIAGALRILCNGKTQVNRREIAQPFHIRDRLSLLTDTEAFNLVFDRRFVADIAMTLADQHG